MSKKLATEKKEKNPGKVQGGLHLLMRNKKMRSIEIKKQLLPVLEVVLEQVEGIPKQVQFLDARGNWPLCKTQKCKKTGKYAVYSKEASQKPKYCGGCRLNNMVHVHYNNLRVHLQSKGLLQSYVVDMRDVNACTDFGKRRKFHICF